MRRVGPIFRRELVAYFQSSSTYVALSLLFLISGVIFFRMFELFVHDSALAQAGGPFGAPGEAPDINVALIQDSFRLLSAMFFFTIPILAMRLVAGERSSGTLEVLLTQPVTDWEILLGKYLALLAVGAVIVLLSAVYPLTAYLYGADHGVAPEPSIIFGCLLGLFLIFAAYAAFGLMASSLSDSQVTAAIVTLIGLFLWHVISELRFRPEALRRFVDEFSAARHTENLLAGLLSVRDLVFYVLAAFFFLFLAARVVESRRWRG